MKSLKKMCGGESAYSIFSDAFHKHEKHQFNLLLVRESAQLTSLLNIKRLL